MTKKYPVTTGRTFFPCLFLATALATQQLEAFEGLCLAESWLCLSPTFPQPAALALCLGTERQLCSKGIRPPEPAHARPWACCVQRCPAGTAAGLPDSLLSPGFFSSTGEEGGILSWYPKEQKSENSTEM